MKVDGRRVKAARALTGLTQERLADVLQVTPVTVVNWEKGRTQPRGDLLVRLSRLSGVPVDDFFVPER